ncbi:39S ribosomal protein L51, mitochondrial-like [Mizuhopecten yessoensis]|uniref:39S ribosomal protein L51, mitochondrial-like n=1 Tax=Mizuhopecten yessoensis TaxID=6573 RepID=UPI000B45F080|nr:39S ribosomal protein L51, mitochondrial-like [Mizuhopecten yessoensis]
MASSFGKLLNVARLSKHSAASFSPCASKVTSTPGCVRTWTLLAQRPPLLKHQPLVSCFQVSCCSSWSPRHKPKGNKKNNSEHVDEVPGTRFRDGPNKYQPKSPFKISTPRSYGYHEDIFRGGVLPRDDKPFRAMKKYQVKNRWDEKHSLFGQNDYIDILGDGDVHPADLQKGPLWLIGQKDRSELHRLLRRLRMEGGKIKAMYPTKYEAMNKRVRYLYRRYNKTNRSHKIS